MEEYVVIDADNNKILEHFIAPDRNKILEDYKNKNKWADISIDIDGDIILWKK